MCVGLSRPFSNGKQIAGVSVWKSMLHGGISKASNIDVHSFCYVLGTGDFDGVFTWIAECMKRDPSNPYVLPKNRIYPWLQRCLQESLSSAQREEDLAKLFKQ